MRQREQHDQDLRRAADRRHGAARPHLRRPRQVLPRDHRGVRRGAGRRRRRCSRTPRSTSWSATCRSVPRRPRSSTPSAPSTPRSPSSTRCRSSSPAPGVGRRSSPRPACRSSATTSSPRSARPSRTACWRSCSRTAASSCSAPMQLNVGGNMDFMNMLERERLESKKISKTQSVTSQIPHDLGKGNVHIGPSDYVAVARRPQVGLRAPRGHGLRRRAAEPGVQARGLGLARTRPASSSTPCAPRRSPWTAASAARSCRRRSTS